jgi:YggT family protein
VILFANLLIGIGNILHVVLNFFIFMLIANVVVSWVNADPYNPLVRFINGFCDPALALVRRRMRTTFGQLDIAPLILLLLAMFLNQVIAQSLVDYGRQFAIMHSI